MKSKIISTMTISKYPCIVKYDDGLVILFTKKGCGTVLVEGDSIWSIGHYSESWSHDGAKVLDKVTIEFKM